MAQQSKRISARLFETIKEPGMYADGDGLYLIVSPTGMKRWAYIFQWKGKRSEMGLGRLSLALAREKAAAARLLVADGVNPIQARKDAAAASERGTVTFGQEADLYVATHAPGFRNSKHIAQWKMTLSVAKDDEGSFVDSGYCLPLRDKPVASIDTADVLAVLKPIWQAKPETASRLRGRIERVLDAAKVRGHRKGENPALWRGHLATLLPKPKKLSKGHHPAVPYDECASFMADLDKVQGMGAHALRFLVLTVGRVSEVVGAPWDEIDWGASLWIVPKERMKTGVEHRVPLSVPAMELLQHLRQTSTGKFIFAGPRKGSHISGAAVTKALGAAGGSDYTVHGFRSSFLDWVGEETSFPENLADIALAHVVGDATKRAYRRKDALAKRRKLMEAWARYCLPRAGNVVQLARGTA